VVPTTARAGIEEYARTHSLSIAATPSLAVYASEWENGKRHLSEEYAAILRAILGVTDDELYGTSQGPAPKEDGYDELVASIEAARNLSRGMVGTLLAQTELLRTMDRQVGAATLVDQMSAHLASLQDALTFAVLPDARKPVARALAGAATLAAWQALDVGAAHRAWKHYELAKTAARDAEEPVYLAHAMAEQAYVLVAAGRPELALALAREAKQTGGGRLPPRLVAWLNAAEAELCALTGDEAECRRALDRATDALPPGPEARDPGMPSIFLNESHLSRWRGNALALVGDDAAVDELYCALAGLDESFVRARAGFHCDLAQAHLVRGELEEARAQLGSSRQLARQTGSVRHRRRVDRLSRTL
jgi:hypothetical protein